jgi:hypothetical protein
MKALAAPLTLLLLLLLLLSHMMLSDASPAHTGR